MNGFARSPHDLDFRKLVSGRLAGAKKEVIVVTGEFSAFSRYIELQWAVQEARERGVQFRIYANTLLPGISRKLLRWGCTIHVGAKPAKEHFMLIDGKEAIISRKHPPSTVGLRHGLATTQGIARLKCEYRRLSASGTCLHRERRPDPLKGFLSRPPLAIIKNAHGLVDDSLVRT